MPNLKRALVLCLFTTALLAVSSGAVASEEWLILATEAETETDTGTPSSTSGITPAEDAETAGEDDAEQPWTFRFLAPLVLTLGVVGLVISLLAYVIRLKSRYRVVQ